MQLLHSVVIFCVAALAAGSSVDMRSDGPVTPVQPSTPGQRQTILQTLGSSRHWRWLLTVTKFLELLDDQEVSDKFFDLVEGRRTIMEKARSCLQKNILDTLNDATNTFGRVVSVLRMGQPAMTSLSDLRTINPASMLPILWFTLQTINPKQVLSEGEEFVHKTADNCLNGDLQQYKNDVDFILKAIDTKVPKK